MVVLISMAVNVSGGEYKGRYCSGKGDVEFLRLIDDSFGFFHPNPDYQNISMLYVGDWDALTEGWAWQAWWVQNSYGPTFCSLPFLKDPWLTALQHSQDFWFDFQGDGERKCPNTGMVGPVGSLCDAAHPKGAVYKQGDCNWQIHDWFYEAAAAGVVMQAELMLVSRDPGAISHYLPKLDLACEFIERTRDPENGLFLVGPASNLLAPSYGGVRQPDGTFGKGYLAGVSVTYLAACDRMIELFRLTGDRTKAALYESRREATRRSLPLLHAPRGYFVKSVEPDGIRHGVYGQERYGYFDAVVNVDAVAMRVADREQSDRIYWQIATLPELRPHDYIITNYPSLDDTYENWGSGELGGFMQYGMWVNGGAWSTVEARAIMAYYRLGKHEDVRRSALRTAQFADTFQMEAPLKDFGKTPWFDHAITNFCYDALGVPAAVVRGLFEYIYRADSLTLCPHIPPGIEEYTQLEPVRFGKKRITIAVKNGGPRVISAKVNGREAPVDGPESVTLPYDSLPDRARVEIVTTGGWPPVTKTGPARACEAPRPAPADVELPEALRDPYLELLAARKSVKPGSYEQVFADAAIATFDACRERAARDAAGHYPQLSPEKRAAILKLYEDAALNMHKGFSRLRS